VAASSLRLLVGRHGKHETAPLFGQHDLEVRHVQSARAREVEAVESQRPGARPQGPVIADPAARVDNAGR